MDMDKAKIHTFAERWISEFQARHICKAEQLMGDQCAALGCVMDCGKSFAAKYSDAFMDNESLVRYISGIDDLQLLGNAIYSQWRFYQHWACSPWDVSWFLPALNRMTELSLELTKGDFATALQDVRSPLPDVRTHGNCIKRERRIL